MAYQRLTWAQPRIMTHFPAEFSRDPRLFNHMEFTQFKLSFVGSISSVALENANPCATIGARINELLETVEHPD